VVGQRPPSTLKLAPQGREDPPDPLDRLDLKDSKGLRV